MNYYDLNILYLTTKEIPDYLQDAVYMGFRELGCNVVDFPRRASLHGSWSRPDYHIEQLLFNYSDLELKKTPIDLLIVTGMVDNYNLCGTFEGWNQFVNNMIAKYRPLKTVMLDAEDFSKCGYPILSKNFDVVFKRELFSRPYPNWYSLNFSAIPEHFEFVPYSEREYDVSFVMTTSHQNRNTIKEFLLKITKELNLSAFIYLDRNPLPRIDYLKILSQSKTSMSIRGMGCDCYRYWEIPAKGVVMIADDHGLLIENDFNSEQIFKFKSLEELEKILLLLKTAQSEILEKMAIKALQHTAAFHTPTKRAEYIISTSGVLK